jgi:GNAT superfamily N-acetyltransferase
MVTVADCERTQADWYASCARVAGGATWTDEGLAWSWLAHERSLMLMFPTTIAPAALARGVARGAEQGVTIVGAWLGLDVDPGPLAAAGFERGWSPWWMSAPLAAVAGPADDRVSIEDGPPEHDDPADRDLLALTRARPRRDWHAAARVDGRLAGRAWSHRAGALAGIFDMVVWPKFRRRGLGTGLMRAVCAEAAAAGAGHAVLNATADGERLYSTLGFERLGDGITWWLHR